MDIKGILISFHIHVQRTGMSQDFLREPGSVNYSSVHPQLIMFSWTNHQSPHTERVTCEGWIVATGKTEYKVPASTGKGGLASLKPHYNTLTRLLSP